MKKFIFAAAALIFAATSVLAQTPEEKQASADRIVILKAPAPKDCGVAEIDNVVAKCKSVAAGTVAVGDITASLSGDAVAADPAALIAKIEAAGKDLGEVGKMLGDAAGALKNIKNPLKIKSATKSIDYANQIAQTAGAELPYQGKVVAAMVKK